MATIMLTDLPPEVLQNILVFLDIPSLSQTSRTSHLLRNLSLDPLLQKLRFQHTRHDLNILLAHRAPKSSISPPNAWIWLSKTNVLSRSISKSLIRIRLSHSLERRPQVAVLVERAILPECCTRVCTGVVSAAIVRKQEDVRKLRLKNKIGKFLRSRPSVDQIVELNILPLECARGTVSPRLVEARRRVIKERLKDGLSSWVKRRAVEEQRRKEEEYDRGGEAINVKAIVRLFSARKAVAAWEEGADIAGMDNNRAQIQWGRAVVTEKRRERKRAAFGACSQPTRAHVLGLRRFWEEVTQTSPG